MKKNKKSVQSSLLLKLMITCVILSLIMLGIIAYDKLIKKSCDCDKQVAECYNK